MAERDVKFNVEAEVKGADSFKKMAEEVRKAEKAVKSNSQEIKNTGKASTAAANATKTSMDAVVSSTDRATNSTRKLKTELQNVGKEAGKTAAGLMIAYQQAKTLSGQIGGLGGAALNVASSTAAGFATGGKIGAAAMGGAALIGEAKSYNPYAARDKALSEVNAIESQNADALQQAENATKALTEAQKAQEQAVKNTTKSFMEDVKARQSANQDWRRGVAQQTDFDLEQDLEVSRRAAAGTATEEDKMNAKARGYRGANQIFSAQRAKEKEPITQEIQKLVGQAESQAGFKNQFDIKAELEGKYDIKITGDLASQGVQDQAIQDITNKLVEELKPKFAEMQRDFQIAQDKVKRLTAAVSVALEKVADQSGLGYSVSPDSVDFGGGFGSF
jgi:hypothetical protein